jgi:formyl-CoA transferase
MNRPDLLTDSLYMTMKDRLANDASLDDIVRQWISAHNYVKLKEIVDKEGVPVNLIYSIADIFEDPHYASRENILEIPHPTLGTIKMPGIMPKFSLTPGEVKWAGPPLGAHNEEIYCGMLGLEKEQLEALKKEEII